MHGVKGFLATAVAGMLMFGALGSALAENTFEKEVEKERLAVKLVGEVQRGGYNVMTAETLKQQVDAGKDILIIDTMPFEASYKKSHVPGARQFLFPIPDMDAWDTRETDGKTLEDFIRLLGPDKEKMIVFYCGFVKCTRSHNGAAWAVKSGYKSVYRFPGGIYAWKGSGYPDESAE